MSYSFSEGSFIKDKFCQKKLFCSTEPRGRDLSRIVPVSIWIQRCRLGRSRVVSTREKNLSQKKSKSTPARKGSTVCIMHQSETMFVPGVFDFRHKQKTSTKVQEKWGNYEIIIHDCCAERLQHMHTGYKWNNVC